MPLMNVKFERKEQSYGDVHAKAAVVFTVRADTVTDAIESALDLLNCRYDWNCIEVTSEKS